MLQSTNGEVGSPPPAPTASRKGSWSLRSSWSVAAPDAPDAGKAADGDGGHPAVPPDPADSSPTLAGMRAATAAAAAAGKAPATGPAATDVAEAQETEVQPRNLDEDMPPPKDLDADRQGREPDESGRQPQRQSQEQRLPSKNLDQLTREAQVTACTCVNPCSCVIHTKLSLLCSASWR